MALTCSGERWGGAPGAGFPAWRSPEAKGTWVKEPLRAREAGREGMCVHTSSAGRTFTETDTHTQVLCQDMAGRSQAGTVGFSQQVTEPD